MSGTEVQNEANSPAVEAIPGLVLRIAAILLARFMKLTKLS